MIALDTETTLATNAEPVPRLVSVAVATNEGVQLYAAHDPWQSVVAEAFYRGVCFANAPFDVHVLLRACPELLSLIVDAYEHDRVHDVLTREKLIDIAEGQHRKRGKYNLGAVAQRRAGVDVDKSDPWRLRYGELLGKPLSSWPAEARTYAERDATATLATWQAQERFRAAHAIDVFADAHRQGRKHLALYSQTLRGLHTDQAQVDRVDAELVRDITTHTLVCFAHGLARVGGTKKKPKISRIKKKAEELLLEVCGDNVPRTAPTKSRREGSIKLDEDTLTALRVPPGHPLDHWRKLGSKQALRTKYIDTLRHPLVRTRYDECVGSGRVSGSGFDPQYADGWVGDNYLNQPREGGFRECLVPAPEHRLVVSDWKGAELVTLAQVQHDLFGHSALADMMRAGLDPHVVFACQILGIRYDEFDKKRPEHKDARQGAKAFNFGKPGGMGQRRFIAYALSQYGRVFTPEEERALDAEWHRTFPEMRLFFDYVSSLEGPDGLITIMQPRSGRIRGGLRFPEACNTHFQGLAADCAGLALWWLWRQSLEPSSALYGGVPIVAANGRVGEVGGVLHVYDENVTQVRAEVAEQARHEQDQIMIAAFRHFCPNVPIEVESGVFEQYGKAA